MPTTLIPSQKPSKTELSPSPLVSVVMPAYKSAATLARSIESVQQQTYQNWELWVVVDGSPDDCLEIAEGFAQADSRIHVLWQENSGVSVARNNGMSNSRGELIAFLDSDDIWFPDKLSIEIDTLRNSPDPIGYTYSWYYV